MKSAAALLALIGFVSVSQTLGAAVTLGSGECILGGSCTFRFTIATDVAHTNGKIIITVSDVQSDYGSNLISADIAGGADNSKIATLTSATVDKKQTEDRMVVSKAAQTIEVQKLGGAVITAGAIIFVTPATNIDANIATIPGLTAFKVTITTTQDATGFDAWIPVFAAGADTPALQSIALGTSYIKDTTPGTMTIQFFPKTALAAAKEVILTASDAIFTKNTAADAKYVKSVGTLAGGTTTVSALTNAATVTAKTDAAGKVCTIVFKDTVAVTANLMVQIVLETTAGNTLLAKNPAAAGLVSIGLTTTDDATASSVNVPIFNKASESLFLKATRATTYVKSAATPGALDLFIVPSADIVATKIITFTASAAAFTARRATATAAANGVDADATAATSSTTAVAVTLANVNAKAKFMKKIQISTQLAANPATVGPMNFKTDADGGDTEESGNQYGYTVFNHADTAFFTSASRTSLVTGAAGGDLVLKFVPQTSIVGNNAAKTVTFTANKALFSGAAPAVTCTSKLGNLPSKTVTCTAAVTGSNKVLTVTATTAGQNFEAQAICTVTVTDNLAVNGAAGDAITFDLATAHEATATGAQTGYTLVAVPASSTSANSTSANSTSATTATGTETTVTQVYTFADLTVAAYTGKMKSNCECAYANTVEGATTPTWCVATTSAYTYKTGVAMSSTVAARRAAKVTFVLKVKSSIKSTAQLQTLVASGSTATAFATALAAVNTASNYTAAPGTATVATATFTGGSSSASTLLPSMLSLVAAIFVAARQ